MTGAVERVDDVIRKPASTSRYVLSATVFTHSLTLRAGRGRGVSGDAQHLQRLAALRASGRAEG
jgi:pyruvate/2-oxoglutarate/acetoin dehydrogenase E1 component